MKKHQFFSDNALDQAQSGQVILKSRPPMAGIDYDRYGFVAPQKNAARPQFVIGKPYVSATPSKNTKKMPIKQADVRAYNQTAVSAQLADTKSFSDKEYSYRAL